MVASLSFAEHATAQPQFVQNTLLINRTSLQLFFLSITYTIDYNDKLRILKNSVIHVAGDRGQKMTQDGRRSRKKYFPGEFSCKDCFDPICCLG